MQPYYRDTLKAYADIIPSDGQTTTFTPAQPPAAPTCTNGTVIPSPADHRELVKDCETLLAVGHTLRGTTALNWSTGTALTGWTGVTTGGTPTRVTGLSLANQSLSGTIPPENRPAVRPDDAESQFGNSADRRHSRRTRLAGSA